MQMLLSPFIKTVKSIPRWQSLARHTTDRRWRAFDKKIKTGKVFGTHRNKQKSRICLMLLPCSLQLDLTGQKVIFGITPQLLLLLACSQTCATPCPTCTRKTAGGGPSQSKGISWANLMHSHPYCQPAQVPQDKQIPSGLPHAMLWDASHSSGNGSLVPSTPVHKLSEPWRPVHPTACTGAVNHLPHTSHRSHCHRGISCTAHSHQLIHKQ